MARVFAVTSSAGQVALDAEGRGKATFTVTNKAAEPLEVRALVVPEAPAAADWFQPLEPAERHLVPEGTEQFAVALAVPAGTAAGVYSFRLDAVSVANPDEDCVEGPSVGFEVGRTGPPKETAALRWDRILLSAVLAAAAALAIVAINLWLFNLAPEGVVDKLCAAPETGTASSFGEAIGQAIGQAIACALALLFAAALFYFPLAFVISVLLIRRMVAERRRLHALLAALLSVPMAFVLLWLISRLS